MGPVGISDGVERVVAEALNARPAAELIAVVCPMLVAAGVPLTRVWVGERTLHPVLAGFGYSWMGGAEVVPTTFEIEQVTGSEKWRQSPFHYMVANELPELRYSLWQQNAPAEFPILSDLRERGATDYFAPATAFVAAHWLGPVKGVVCPG